LQGKGKNEDLETTKHLPEEMLDINLFTEAGGWGKNKTSFMKWPRMEQHTKAEVP
jgi:hypothetical protein